MATDFTEHNERMSHVIDELSRKSILCAKKRLGKHKPGLYERTCLDCGTDKTRIKDAGKYRKRIDGSDAVPYPVWHYVEGGFICDRCYHRYQMRELHTPVVFQYGRGGHDPERRRRIRQREE